MVIVYAYIYVTLLKVGQLHKHIRCVYVLYIKNLFLLSI